jgi:2-aminoethylphosphonate-pyruvate transaminase
MRARFGISDEYDVCLISGSGTAANEAVMSSILPASLNFHPQGGEFQSRLKKLRLAHTWCGYKPGDREQHHVMVAYETGEGRRLKPVWPEGGLAGLRFADCISSFPYYYVPRNTDVWTTVSSKQLGALPVISMVVVRNACWKWFREAGLAYSYLNLRRYAETFKEKWESPHTPAIALLHDLFLRLETFDTLTLREQVDNRRAMFNHVFTSSVLIGEGPVVIVKPEYIPPRLAERWNLYRCPLGWQFFLYTGTDEQYGEFLDEVRSTDAS